MYHQPDPDFTRYGDLDDLADDAEYDYDEEDFEDE